MGILAEDVVDDVKALRWVIEKTLQAWEQHGKKGRYSDVEFECHFELLEKLSVAGGTLLKKKFPQLSVMDRVAALVVIFNCSPLFKVSRNGRFISNLTERTVLFSNLTSAFVNCALRLFPCNNPRGFYVFSGIPDLNSRYRFYAFLELLGSVEIVAISSIKSETLTEKQLQALNVMTRDIISVVNFLAPGTLFVLSPETDAAAGNVDFEPGLELGTVQDDAAD